MRVVFPRTPHVITGDLRGGGVARDDLVLTRGEAQRFVRPGSPRSALAALVAAGAAHLLPASPLSEVELWLVAEEKIDGANLGISLSPDGTLQCQNRSHFVNGATHTQFQTLPAFLDAHRAPLCAMFEALSCEHGGHPHDWFLFGEWCAYTHSVFYDALPEALVVFDLCRVTADDAATAAGAGGGAGPSVHFLSTNVRNVFVRRFCPDLPTVPRLGEWQLSSGEREQQQDGGLSWDALHALWIEKPSGFSAGVPMEGAVFRLELRWTTATGAAPGSASSGGGGVLVRRCKAVRDDFLRGIEERGHWLGQAMRKNIVLHYDPRSVEDS